VFLFGVLPFNPLFILFSSLHPSPVIFIVFFREPLFVLIYFPTLIFPVNAIYRPKKAERLADLRSSSSTADSSVGSRSCRRWWRAASLRSWWVRRATRCVFSVRGVAVIQVSQSWLYEFSAPSHLCFYTYCILSFSVLAF